MLIGTRGSPKSGLIRRRLLLRAWTSRPGRAVSTLCYPPDLACPHRTISARFRARR